MKDIKNVLICGLGAIGSIYAEIIKKTCTLKVLVDENRLNRYKTNPLIFNGKELIVDYILPSETNFKADLIIIATKFDGLNDAVKNIQNFVNDDTVILSLLNGINSEKIIAEKYGEEKILDSYFIGHSAVRVGRKVEQDGVHTIVFGTDKNFNNLERVKDFFDKAKINYEIPQDIKYSMWLKYMLNVSTNQTSAILGYNFGQIMNNKKCMDFVIEIMKEVQAIAKAEGIQNSEKMLQDALKALAKMTPDGKTSMLQDIEAGRKTEVEMFAGTMVALGKKYSIPTPYNTVLKGLIEAKEQI